MRYEAVCFDLDGVLIDSEASHRDAFQRTAKQFGYVMDDDDYARYFAGKTDAQGIAEYARGYDDAFDQPAFARLKAALYVQSLNQQLEQVQSSVQVAKTLSSSLPLALVTGSTRDEAFTALSFCGLTEAFTVVISAESVAQSKPSPEGYRMAASRLNIAPVGCIAVEDSPSGVAAVKAAGMYCIALTTIHAVGELAKADVIVSELSLELFHTLLPNLGTE